jgi:hypothetical protein
MCTICGTRADYRIISPNDSEYYCHTCRELVVLPLNGSDRSPQGAFEHLMADIEETIKNAEGDWWLDCDTLIVQTIVSRDPRRSRNGGEYSFYREYRSNGVGGVEVYGSWSAEFDYEQYNLGDREQYDCIVSGQGLDRMARMADLTSAARAWLAKEKGCMAKLKKAVPALGMM